MPQVVKKVKGLTPEAPLTPGERKWSDYVSQPPTLDKNGIPEAPGMFRPEPNVVGTELAKKVHRLLTIAPSLRGSVKTVVHGPTSASESDMVRSKRNPDQFLGMNLLGITDTNKGEIGINPGLSDDPKENYYDFTGDNLSNTLVHELSHVAGYGERKANGLEDVIAGRNPKLPVAAFDKDWDVKKVNPLFGSSDKKVKGLVPNKK